jgi:hypothetical protein
VTLPINQREPRPAYLPPPPQSRDDSPDVLDVPRMDPPPSSLLATLKNRLGTPVHERQSVWIWVLGVLTALAVAAYLLGLQR